MADIYHTSEFSFGHGIVFGIRIDAKKHQKTGGETVYYEDKRSHDLHDNIDEGSIADFLSGSFVKISFKMEIGDLVDSEIMQLYPVSFAKEMCASITKNMEADTNSTSNEAEKAVSAQPAAPQPQMEQPMGGQQVMGQPMMGQPMMGQPMMAPNMNQMYAQPVNVQPAQFQAFNPSFAQVAGA